MTSFFRIIDPVTGELQSLPNLADAMKKTEKKAELSRTKRLYRLVFARRRPGVCSVCGCTMFNPCHNPKYGYCWWHDAEETVCSHCANKEIFLDPATEHCINS